MLEPDYRKFEALVTLLALIGQIIRMDPDVSLKRPTISECFATDITLIWLIRTMFPHVTFECPFSGEWL